MPSHAADNAADLIFMGGDGHPRAWEPVLGGVTRTLLKTMTVPVFMSPCARSNRVVSYRVVSHRVVSHRVVSHRVVSH